MLSIPVGSGGMIYVPSFVKIGAGIQAILRFWFSNLNDCNVSITDEHLISAPLRWAQVA
jgi:hypothetical protein